MTGTPAAAVQHSGATVAENAHKHTQKHCKPPLAALLFALVLVAAALTQGPRAYADEYSDALLEAFASAAIEVSRRIETWRPLIESAADEDGREALIEEAQADLARAIEETEGIDEDEYYAIYEAAREDELLRNRLNEIFSANLQRPQVPRAE
ncbi:MAG: DUF4168 domain-containing protein [Rhodospirillales bacterium]|nr:DUF4168 domain-containing protein [Rhodospirillales bacterium]